ncbi:MAG: hypothetical protein E7351_02735 [Clostridiales bacterium]|nr:hypothetical protein [Clostridiales bacterium]
MIRSSKVRKSLIISIISLALVAFSLLSASIFIQFSSAQDRALPSASDTSSEISITSMDDLWSQLQSGGEVYTYWYSVPYYTNHTHFTISSADEWIYFAKLVSGGCTFYGKTVLLENDIDFKGATIEMVGDSAFHSYGSKYSEVPTYSSKGYKIDDKNEYEEVWIAGDWFVGTFDGQGHVLSNYIIKPKDIIAIESIYQDGTKKYLTNSRFYTGHVYCQGLFTVLPGTVKNLRLTQFTINVRNFPNIASFDHGYFNSLFDYWFGARVGGIAGMMLEYNDDSTGGSGKITCCQVDNFVIGNRTSANYTETGNNGGTFGDYNGEFFHMSSLTHTRIGGICGFVRKGCISNCLVRDALMYVQESSRYLDYHNIYYGEVYLTGIGYGISASNCVVDDTSIWMSVSSDSKNHIYRGITADKISSYLQEEYYCMADICGQWVYDSSPINTEEYKQYKQVDGNWIYLPDFDKTDQVGGYLELEEYVDVYFYESVLTYKSGEVITDYKKVLWWYEYSYSDVIVLGGNSVVSVSDMNYRDKEELTTDLISKENKPYDETGENGFSSKIWYEDTSIYDYPVLRQFMSWIEIETYVEINKYATQIQLVDSKDNTHDIKNSGDIIYYPEPKSVEVTDITSADINASNKAILTNLKDEEITLQWVPKADYDFDARYIMTQDWGIQDDGSLWCSIGFMAKTYAINVSGFVHNKVYTPHGGIDAIKQSFGGADSGWDLSAFDDGIDSNDVITYSFDTLTAGYGVYGMLLNTLYAGGTVENPGYVASLLVYPGVLSDGSDLEFNTRLLIDWITTEDREDQTIDLTVKWNTRIYQLIFDLGSLDAAGRSYFNTQYKSYELSVDSNGYCNSLYTVEDSINDLIENVTNDLENGNLNDREFIGWIVNGSKQVKESYTVSDNYTGNLSFTAVYADSEYSIIYRKIIDGGAEQSISDPTSYGLPTSYQYEISTTIPKLPDEIVDEAFYDEDGEILSDKTYYDFKYWVEYVLDNANGIWKATGLESETFTINSTVNRRKYVAIIETLPYTYKYTLQVNLEENSQTYIQGFDSNLIGKITDDYEYKEDPDLTDDNNLAFLFNTAEDKAYGGTFLGWKLISLTDAYGNDITIFDYDKLYTGMEYGSYGNRVYEAVFEYPEYTIEIHTGVGKDDGEIDDPFILHSMTDETAPGTYTYEDRTWTRKTDTDGNYYFSLTFEGVPSETVIIPEVGSYIKQLESSNNYQNLIYDSVYYIQVPQYIDAGYEYLCRIRKIPNIIKLQARLIDRVYNVNFDYNGGEEGVESITYTYDAIPDASDMPTTTREGYTFKGWSILQWNLPTGENHFAEGFVWFSIDETGITISNPDGNQSISYGDFDLKAIWEPIEYKVYLDFKGGEPVSYDGLAYDAEKGMYYVGEYRFTYSEAEQTFGIGLYATRPGYNFVGWKDATYNDEGYWQYIIPAETKEDVTIEAEWQTIDYTVSLDISSLYDDEYNQDEINEIYSTLDATLWEAIDMYHYQKDYNIENPIELPNLTINGYKLTWSKISDTIADNDQIGDLEYALSIEKEKYTITLYTYLTEQQWSDSNQSVSKFTYAVTTDEEDGNEYLMYVKLTKTYYITDTIILPDLNNIGDSKLFEGWSLDGDKIDTIQNRFGDLSLHADWGGVSITFTKQSGALVSIRYSTDGGDTYQEVNSVDIQFDTSITLCLEKNITESKYIYTIGDDIIVEYTVDDDYVLADDYSFDTKDIGVDTTVIPLFILKDYGLEYH